MAERRIGIFADDLTGALDSAVPFAVAGLSTFVSLDTTVPPGASNHYAVTSLNMGSRSRTASEASEQATLAVHRLLDAGFQPVFNKIDSTMRGHVGLELQAAVTVLASELAVLTPAFPSTRRRVSDGHLLVRGMPVNQTDVGRDPLSPVAASSVIEVLRRHATLRAIPLPLSSIRRGVTPLADTMELVARSGPAILVADAETDEDLQLLVGAAARCNRRIVLAGSAGLARALASAFAPNAGSREAAATTEVASPYLVIAGSQREVVRAQVETIHRHARAALIVANGDLLLDPAEAGAERDRVTRLAKRALRRGQSAALVLDVPALRTGAGHGGQLLSVARDQLTAELGAVAKAVALAGANALIVVGGDTAEATFRALDVSGVVLQAEPVSGVAAGTILGGLMDGASVVTKAGDFGDEETLLRVFEYLATGRIFK